jgi:hypothetical protein
MRVSAPHGTSCRRPPPGARLHAAMARANEAEPAGAPAEPSDAYPIVKDATDGGWPAGARIAPATSASAAGGARPA